MHPADALGHVQRGNSFAHGFGAFKNNNPYKYTVFDGEVGVFGPVFSLVVKVGIAFAIGSDITAKDIVVAAVTRFVTGGANTVSKALKLYKLGSEALETGVEAGLDVATGTDLYGALVGSLSGIVAGIISGAFAINAPLGGPDLKPGPNTRKINSQIENSTKGRLL